MDTGAEGSSGEGHAEGLGKLAHFQANFLQDRLNDGIECFLGQTVCGALWQE